MQSDIIASLANSDLSRNQINEDLDQVILKIDRMSRYQDLLQSVQNSLQKIRNLKASLKTENEILKELLRTEIGEDADLKELLGSLKDEK